MDILSTLKQVMSGYAKPGFNSMGYLTSSDDQKVFAVVYVSKQRGQHMADAGLIARLKGDCIVIDHDSNDKPLVDALTQAGIPRDHIVLAYASEASGEAA